MCSKNWIPAFAGTTVMVTAKNCSDPFFYWGWNPMSFTSFPYLS
jgi:hypothetical protein